MRRPFSVALLVARNGRLARLVLAYAFFVTTEYAVWIAMLVFAYNRGGATEAALIALAQLAPAALLAPVLSIIADRYPPVRLLVVGYLVQAAAMAATGVAIYAGAPTLVTYACAVVAATAVVSTRPAQAPLTPALSNTVGELTAANVVLGWVDGISVAAAGALTGVVLALADVGMVFVLSAVLAVVAALLVLRLRTPPPASKPGWQGVRRELAAGARVLAKTRRPRLLVALLAAEWVVLGAMDVLFVVLAVDILDKGGEWTGYLNSAYGIGGVLLAVLGAGLVGRRLGLLILSAGLVLSVALALIAVLPGTTATVVLLAVAGGGQAVLDISTRTLLQRAVPPEVIGRVFGVVEGLNMAGAAVGSLLVSVLVAFGGGGAALVGAALVLPLTGLLGARALLALDAEATVPVVEIALLRSLPIFADLPAPSLEALAGSLTRSEVPAGTVLMQEGAPGDRYCVIADGELAIADGNRSLGVCRRGDGVGEIALLHRVPRTATVTAATAATLYALEPGPFLDAVTGHPSSARAAASVAEERLRNSRPCPGQEG